jgi:hypothetical protein
MLTSAKISKQNGDTRTRKPELGYLNISNYCKIVRLSAHYKNISFIYKIINFIYKIINFPNIYMLGMLLYVI